MFGRSDAASVCIRAFADDQLLRLHRCAKPLSKLATWLLLASGGSIALVAGNLDTLAQLLPRTDLPFLLFKISIVVGFLVKLFDAILDFAMSRLGIIGTANFQRYADLEQQFATLVDYSGEDRETVIRGITDEAFASEYSRRLPFWLRLGKRSVVGDEKHLTQFHRILVSLAVSVIFLAIVQSAFFSSAVLVIIQLVEAKGLGS